MTPADTGDELREILLQALDLSSEDLYVDNKASAILDDIIPAVQSFYEQRERTVKLDIINKVFELSPKEKFIDWKPGDAFAFYERLKAFEDELQSPQAGAEGK
jgi:hypothetical protein